MGRLDPVDVALVHVHFDLQRTHVHDGANAGARKAAAGRDGRDHFPGLRVLRGHYPGERSTNDRVIELLFPKGHFAVGDGHVGLLAFQAGLERLGQRLGPIQVRGTGDLAGHELSDAAKFAIGLLEIGPGFLQRLPGRFGLRFGQLKAFLHVGGIQPRQHLAGLDFHPFFHKNLDHFAGYFGRNGRLAPGCHVSGGIEKGLVSP